MLCFRTLVWRLDFAGMKIFERARPSASYKEEHNQMARAYK